MSVRAPPLIARSAKEQDCEVFLMLARLAMAEAGLPFDEGVASHTFAGIGRADPIIHLLEAGGEVVGFALVRFQRAPLADTTCIEHEFVFICSDWRSAEAELALHGLAISLIRATNAADAYLAVSPGPQAGDVIARLADAGLARFTLRVAPGGAPPPTQRELPQERLAATVH